MAAIAIRLTPKILKNETIFLFNVMVMVGCIPIGRPIRAFITKHMSANNTLSKSTFFGIDKASS